jgi:hypothetical protein
MFNWRYGLLAARILIFVLVLIGVCPSSWAQGQQLIFSATGDIPYGTSEVAVYQKQIDDHNKYSPSAFFVHVGDIATGGQCSPSNYEMVANMMKGLAVPAYIVLGDNESADCKTPSQGYADFLKNFQAFEKNFCGAPYTEYQSGRPENFAFTLSGVLFVGVNLSYGGTSAQQQAADWVTQQFEAKGAQVRAAVVFAHYPPGTFTTFTTPFRAASATFAKPVLFLHGHGHSWSTSYPFPEKNIYRVQVNKGVSEDPIQVTVTMDNSLPATAFVIKRSPWSGKTIVNMPPCADAGPDQNISGAAVANLQGQATDDGDPSGSLSTTWSVLSGPGTVTFGNVNTPTTSASFSDNGVYVLRLSADDGQLQKSDEVTIAVNSSGGDAPAISSFTPASGGEGTVVTIDGSNFAEATNVFFNGTAAASFMINSSTQIVTTVPAGATTGKIMILTATSAGSSADDFVVTGSGGSLNTFTFHPTDDAYVQSLSPTINMGSATELRVDTNSASDVTTTYIKFNVTGVHGLLQSAKLRLKCTDGSTQGGSLYAVANDYLDASGPWVETGLLWSNAPAITGSALSSAGSVSAGQLVEWNVMAAITGEGIYSFAIQTTSSNAAMYSAKEGAPPPELIIQTQPIPPTIVSFTPASAKVAAEVTITGSAFNGATAVAFNGKSATFTVDSDTQIRATVPAGATTGKISITNADGSGSSATSFTVLPPLTIASFTPSSGPATTEVTITGDGFLETTAVTFNGMPATGFFADSDTQLRATVPAGATVGKISVTNAIGAGSSAADFLVTAPPAIASFTPANGPQGTEVTITGNYFTGAMGVSFNGYAAASIVVDSDTKIRAKVPAGATPSTGKIEVTNALGTGVSAADFTIDLANTLSFAPKHDTYVKSSSPTTTNGTASTLRGKTGSSEVMQSYLKFDVTGLSGTLHSAKLLLYVSDASVDGGAIYPVSPNYKSSLTPWVEKDLNWNNAPGITDAPISSTGAVSLGQWVEFDMTTAIVGNGAYSFGLKTNNSDQVYYRSKENGAATAPQLVVLTLPSNAPSITSFAPSNGPAESEVTITGNNFTGATEITFNGMPAASFHVDSNTQIRANVPVGGTSGRIKITTPDGSSSFATEFVVTAIPAISSFTPDLGPQGTEVTIIGSNFTGTTSVQFNGQAATLIYLDSDTEIRATVPAGATPSAGKIAVINSAGTAASTNDFTILPPPLVLAPTHDAYIKSSAPTTNYGTSSTVRAKVGSSETFIAYLKFNVAGMSGPLLSAKLRLYVTDDSPDGGGVYLVSNDYLNTATPWEEKGLLWGNAPSIAGTPLSAVGAVKTKQWVEFEVTSAIAGDGVYSFALKNNNSNAVYYGSKESSGTTTDPQLVIQMPSGSSAASKRASNEEIATAVPIPSEFRLEQNYPNPFSPLGRGTFGTPSTQIRFGLPQASHVTIKVYTINGAEVRTLVDAEYPAGTHATTFQAKNLPSGTYFYVMQAGTVRQVRQLMLVK